MFVKQDKYLGQLNSLFHQSARFKITFFENRFKKYIVAFNHYNT